MIDYKYTCNPNCVHKYRLLCINLKFIQVLIRQRSFDNNLLFGYDLLLQLLLVVYQLLKFYLHENNIITIDGIILCYTLIIIEIKKCKQRKITAQNKNLLQIYEIIYTHKCVIYKQTKHLHFASPRYLHVFYMAKSTYF